jgi:hypothetical protein
MFASLRTASCVLLFATTGIAQTTMLEFRPADAEYSKALDRIIAVSSGPNVVHIYDPATGADTVVPLSAEPASVSVGPSGLYAAVAHADKVAYVNLTTAKIEREFNVSGTIRSIVLASQFIHVLPSVSINVATGATLGTNMNYYPASGAALHPSGSVIYSTREGFTPDDIYRLDVPTGPSTSPRSRTT